MTKLNVRYGDFHAVKDLSFQVRRGEFYALLGTNGAGKTSALEVIEGHRPAESGTVRVLGQGPRDRAAVRSRMGIMLQESGFSPDLTVKESVRLIGALTRRHDDVDRVLGIVGLTRKAGTKVSQLSGGEKRRLDFATAVYGAVHVDGAFRVETFSLQEDLYRLLGWAHDSGVDFRELQAGPTRLDDVFRAITGG
ncbi:ATP-binding cassette domain-containing protein [Streptomyces sp. MCAF7]